MTFAKMSIFIVYYLSSMDHSGGQALLFEDTSGELQLHEDNNIEWLEMAGYGSRLSNQMVSLYKTWINPKF